MTKRVVIANLSNWDGEDFELLIRRKATGTFETRKVTIKPGEHADVCWGDDAEVKVTDVQREDPPIRPYVVGAETTDGAVLTGNGLGQTWPKMRIDWESARGQVAGEIVMDQLDENDDDAA